MMAVISCYYLNYDKECVLALVVRELYLLRYALETLPVNNLNKWHVIK